MHSQGTRNKQVKETARLIKVPPNFSRFLEHNQESLDILLLEYRGNITHPNSHFEKLWKFPETESASHAVSMNYVESTGLYRESARGYDNEISCYGWKESEGKEMAVLFCCVYFPSLQSNLSVYPGVLYSTRRPHIKRGISCLKVVQKKIRLTGKGSETQVLRCIPNEWRRWSLILRLKSIFIFKYSKRRKG